MNEIRETKESVDDIAEQDMIRLTHEGVMSEIFSYGFDVVLEETIMTTRKSIGIDELVGVLNQIEELSGDPDQMSQLFSLASMTGIPPMQAKICPKNHSTGMRNISIIRTDLAMLIACLEQAMAEFNRVYSAEDSTSKPLDKAEMTLSITDRIRSYWE